MNNNYDRYNRPDPHSGIAGEQNRPRYASGEETHTEEPYRDERRGCTIYYNERGQRVLDHTRQINARRRNPPSPPEALLVLYIWLCATMILTVVPAFFGEKWTFAAGAIQLAFGTYAFFAAPPEKRRRRLLIMLIPLVIINTTLVAMRFVFPYIFNKVSANIYPSLLAVLFIIIGGIIFCSGFNEVKNKKRCTLHTRAVVTDVRTSNTTDNEGARVTIYTPVIDYQYRGDIYRMDTYRYSNFRIPMAGDRLDIKIDPDDPKKFYLINRDRGSSFFLFMTGFLFEAAGLFFFWLINFSPVGL